MNLHANAMSGLPLATGIPGMSAGETTNRGKGTDRAKRRTLSRAVSWLVRSCCGRMPWGKAHVRRLKTMSEELRLTRESLAETNMKLEQHAALLGYTWPPPESAQP